MSGVNPSFVLALASAAHTFSIASTLSAWPKARREREREGEGRRVRRREEGGRGKERGRESGRERERFKKEQSYEH